GAARRLRRDRGGTVRAAPRRDRTRGARHGGDPPWAEGRRARRGERRVRPQVRAAQGLHRRRGPLMIDRLIAIALRNRLGVTMTAVLLIVAGSVALARLPIDAMPDVTSVQVQILTKAPALGPL